MLKKYLFPFALCAAFIMYPESAGSNTTVSNITSNITVTAPYSGSASEFKSHATMLKEAFITFEIHPCVEQLQEIDRLLDYLGDDINNTIIDISTALMESIVTRNIIKSDTKALEYAHRLTLSLELVKRVLDKCSKVSNNRTQVMTMAFDSACVLKDEAVIQLLINHELFDPNTTVDKDGTTLLMVATEWGNTDAVTALIKRGADINKTDHFGLDALAFAQQLFSDNKKISDIVHDFSKMDGQDDLHVNENDKQIDILLAGLKQEDILYQEQLSQIIKILEDASGQTIQDPIAS